MTASPRTWFQSVLRWPVSLLRAMIRARMAWAARDFTCTGLAPLSGQLRQFPGVIAVGLVRGEGLQSLVRLSARDADEGQADAAHTSKVTVPSQSRTQTRVFSSDTSNPTKYSMLRLLSSMKPNLAVSVEEQPHHYPILKTRLSVPEALSQ